MQPLARSGSLSDISAAAVAQQGSTVFDLRCSTGQLVHAGDAAVRRSYAAGPRTFTATSAERPGLQTGDVVAFLTEEGGMFVVVQEDAEEQEADMRHYGFQARAPPPVTDEKSAHLEIVRQGEWLGFRAVAARGRFLQARRRGAGRLGFSNANLGTWEQWELVAGDPAAPWSRLRLSFRSRRLPQCVMAVEVMRVGTLVLPPDAFITPRSLVPPPGELSEPAALHKISGMVADEWFQFVRREKQVRHRLEGKVNELLTEAAGIKQWTIDQVVALRDAMQTELGALAAALQARGGELACAEARLAARLRWGIALLHRLVHARVCRAVLAAWRHAASEQRRRAVAVVRQERRCDARRCRAALHGWAAVVARRHDLQARLREAVLQAAARRLASGFAAWAGVATAAVAKRQREAAACQQACRLASGFAAWRVVAAASIECRAEADRRAAAMRQGAKLAAFGAWAEEAAACRRLGALLRRSLARSAARRQAVALRAWCVEAARRRLLRRALHIVLARQARARQAAAFGAWREAVAVARARAHKVRVTVNKHLLQLAVGAAFFAWREVVRCRREGRAAMRRMGDVVEQRTVACALAAWRGAVEARRAREALVRRAVLAQAARRQAGALWAWRTWLEARQARQRQLAKAAGQLARLRLRSAITTWLEALRLARVERLVMARIERRLSSRALAAWAAHTRAARSAEARCRMALSRRARGTLASAFSAWQRRTDEAAAAEEGASLLAGRRARQVQCEALGAWHARAAHALAKRRAAAAAAAFLRRSAAKRALSAWRRAAHEVCGNSDAADRIGGMEWGAGSAPRRSGSVDSGAYGLALQLAAYRAWRVHMQAQQRHRTILGRCLERMAARLQRCGLRAWRERAARQRVRRVALERFAAKVQAARVRQALLRWQCAWLEHRAAVARVAGCVTRQRISFRFFKQWYWSMFDEEIQATFAKLHGHPAGCPDFPGDSSGLLAASRVSGRA
ncbi:hypothetical protein WJX81_005093 [Elliptochloris bilobata]|uniref:Sfi1 spindle body domain-containing protein n=1 Tax=Elliptochloris bilobata TaxID=381761 RepID=A0AAW1QJ25_9CHLO